MNSQHSHENPSLSEKAASYALDKAVAAVDDQKEKVTENAEKMLVEKMVDFSLAFREKHPEWQEWWDGLTVEEQDDVLFGSWTDVLLKMTVFGIVKAPKEMRGGFTRALILIGAIQADEATVQKIESKGDLKSKAAETFTKYASVVLPELEPLAIAAQASSLVSGKGREYAEEARTIVHFHDEEMNVIEKAA